MKLIFLPLLLLLSQACTATGSGDPGFHGNWIEIKDRDSIGGSPYSTFELSLNVDGARIAGNYCYVARYGRKIDCDPGEENVTGIIDKGTGVATVSFYSSFGAKGGEAILFIRGDTLIWEVKRQPKGGEFYGPNSATLRAVLSGGNRKGPPNAAAKGPYSHCSAGEQTFFACETDGGKHLSLCGFVTNGLIEGRRYMYGPRGRAELTYPDEMKEGSSFTYNHYHRAMVEYLDIEFTNKQTKYRVFRRYDGTFDDATRYGVEVDLINGKDLQIACTSDVIDRLNQFTSGLSCDKDSALGC